ncbi:metal-dependent hydrolase [Jatrophihabitans telluris]|uniref:Metal-dependent hydrolase n=1 Tax=Jatrophihabitans telluris TaxID=2038343 RepID=A0ABY4QYF6_9ACTN|nr:metal-dependent hydrolase [Jatrophihabitans telluris]UQX88609.1 metal-dependent hydrolase [Jatrophihabitans telluris]
MNDRTAAVFEPGEVALRAREVAFDFSALPPHWIPGEPFASHLINLLHLLLPEGERWFVRVFSEALPLIRDEGLQEQVIGFIGQESMHAEAHQGAQDHLCAAGLETAGFVGELEWFFRDQLGDRGLTGPAAQAWLVERLALIAAIEHMTAVLGDWVLNAAGLDDAGADPVMLDLLRWHGAEEVEHRAVAYDLYAHVDGRYWRRVRTHLLIMPALGWLWARGLTALLASDSELVEPQNKARWRDWFRAGRRGLVPSPLPFLWSYLRYLAPWYHPSREASTSQAVAYLASSPAALAATP